VVAPPRSGGGQRRYSEDDVHRLSLLQRVVKEGWGISQVAELPTAELERLVEEEQAKTGSLRRVEPLSALSAAGVLRQAQRFVNEMDPIHLERVLTRGAVALPIGILIFDVILPLLENIGALWREGELGPAREHLASRTIRRVLDGLLDTMGVGEGAPVLLAATPPGEMHEFGALLTAVFAATEGWRGIFLGPDLPAKEIAEAALLLKVRVVALSSVCRGVGEGLVEEIRELRAQLPGSTRIIVGGPREMTVELSGVVEGVEVMSALGELRRTLRAEVVSG